MTDHNKPSSYAMCCTMNMPIALLSFIHSPDSPWR